jgi:hypothetical protein
MADSYGELTSDAKELLLKMCEEYELRRAAGMDKKQSRGFGNATDVHDKFVQYGSDQDTLETLSELMNANFISAWPGSDSLADIELTNTAVSWKEQRVGNGLRGLIPKIGK